MYPSFARLGASRPPQHVQVETTCRRVGEPHRTAVWLKDGVRILERVNFGKKITGGVKIIRAQDYAGVDTLVYVRPGDTLMVWKLDRAGRSLKHLIELLTSLDQHQIGFRSLTEQIDTTTPGGKLIFHLMGALAEFERDLIRERTNAGLAAARARGRVGGRPRKLKTNGKVALARQMFADQSHSIPEICTALGISRATLYRYVKEAKTTE